MLYLTYLGGGHEMSRAVKHVIDPASDPKVAISIALSTVPRHVVTREPREIGFLEPFIWGKKVNSEKKYHRQSTCLGPHRQCAWCQARGGRTQCNLHLPLSPKKSNEYDSWFIISWLFLPLSPLHPICEAPPQRMGSRPIKNLTREQWSDRQNQFLPIQA